MDDALEVRHLVDGVRADPGAARLVGHAIVTNARSADLGGFLEVISPEALQRALARDPDLVALVNHNADRVLGRRSAKTLRVVQDPEGLAFEIDPPEHERGLVESIKRGDVTGASFAFRTIKDQWDDSVPPVRTLLDFELRELSVGVPF